MNENDIKQAVEPEKVACEVCHKNILTTDAQREEATDYIIYFCGLNCYDQWKHQEASDD